MGGPMNRQVNHLDGAIINPAKPQPLYIEQLFNNYYSSGTVPEILDDLMPVEFRVPHTSNRNLIIHSKRCR